ncbi:MAG: hypothetical protein ACJAWV_001440, partial [Flammeovirgaceae bacterium]
MAFAMQSIKGTEDKQAIYLFSAPKIFETDGMKKDLRIIFMGTPDFAVPSLEK